MKKMPCLFKRTFNNDHTATITREVNDGCEWVLNGFGKASMKIDGTSCAIIDGKLYARYDRKLKIGKALKKAGYYIELLKVGMKIAKTSNKPFKNGDAFDVIVGFGDNFEYTGERFAYLENNPPIDLRQIRPIAILIPEKYFKPVPSTAIPCQEPDLITGHWPHWVPVDDSPQYKYHREAWKLKFDRKDGTYELIGPKVQGNIYGLSQHLLVRHGSEIVINAPRTFDDIFDWLSTHNIEGIVYKYGDKYCKIRRRDFGLEWPIKEKQ